MPRTAIPDQERSESPIPPSTRHKRYTQPSVQGTVAYQYLDGSSCLVDVEFGRNLEGGLVFNNAGPCISRTLSERWHYKILTALSTRTTIGISEVQQVLIAKSPSTSSLSQVYLQGFTPNPLLTDAYHDPNISSNDWIPSSNDYHLPTAFVARHQDLKGHRIIVIRRIIDKKKVDILLALPFIISPTSGLVVGLCSHKAQLGIAVSVGVFTLASYIKGLADRLQE